MDTEIVSGQLFSRLSLNLQTAASNAPVAGETAAMTSSPGTNNIIHNTPRPELVNGHRHEHDDHDDDHDHDDHHHHSDHAAESGTLSYRRSEGTSLMVETQEGDLVRLKIRASDTVSVGTGQETEDGHTVSELEVQASSRTRIAVKVNGDLNEQELTAIQSIIDQAGAMANEFFAGNLDAAFSTASTLEIDATQLANVRIRMRTSEHFTYSSTGVLATLVRNNADTTGMPAETATPAVTAESTAANTAPAEQAATAGSGTQHSTAAAQPETQAAPVTDEAAVSDETGVAGRNQLMANVLQSIGEFLNRLVSEFGNGDSMPGNAQPSDETTMKLQVFRSIVLSVTARQQEDNQTAGLVADTIDAVSGQQLMVDAVA